MFNQVKIAVAERCEAVENKIRHNEEYNKMSKRSDEIFHQLSNLVSLELVNELDLLNNSRLAMAMEAAYLQGYMDGRESCS